MLFIVVVQDRFGPAKALFSLIYDLAPGTGTDFAVNLHIILLS